MMEKDQDGQAIIVRPTAALQMVSRNEMAQHLADLDEYVHHVLKEGIHFSKRPGYAKPSLEKPGAEVLLKAFMCWPRFSDPLPMSYIDHQGQYAYIAYRCEAIHIQSGVVFASAIGSATSDRDGYEGKQWGWIINAVDKMAQKSAMIACTLILGAVSQHFTQDTEDSDAPSDNGLRCPQHNRKLKEWSGGKVLKCTKKLSDGTYCTYETANPDYQAQDKSKTVQGGATVATKGQTPATAPPPTSQPVTPAARLQAAVTASGYQGGLKAFIIAEAPYLISDRGLYAAAKVTDAIADDLILLLAELTAPHVAEPDNSEKEDDTLPKKLDDLLPFE